MALTRCKCPMKSLKNMTWELCSGLTGICNGQGVSHLKQIVFFLREKRLEQRTSFSDTPMEALHMS